MKSITFYILPLILGYLTVIAVNETERFATDGGSGRIHKKAQSPTECTWACHDKRQHCFNKHLYGLPKGIKKIVRGPLDWMMDTLKNGKDFSFYQLANVLLLAFLWPLLLSIMIMHIAKRYESVQRVRPFVIPIALIGLASLLSVYILQYKRTGILSHPIQAG